MGAKQLLSTADTIRARRQYDAYAIEQSAEGELKSYPEWVLTSFIGTQVDDTKGAQAEREEMAKKKRGY